MRTREDAQRYHRRAGFTLIELLVTLAVVVIMATVAVPSYQAFSARNEVAAEVMRLKSALAMTRNAAITKRTTITLCPTQSMVQCQISDNTDGDAWRASLAIFEGQGVTGDTLLHTFGKSQLPTMTYRNDDRPVRYMSLGRSSGYNGTFRLCGRLGEGASVIVNNFGRVRVEPERPDC